MPAFTPNKAFRAPLPSERAGFDDFQQLAYDIDAAFTAEDTTRSGALRRPRAHIFNASSSNQSFTKATMLQLTFGTTDFDNNGMVSGNTLVCKTAGLYYASAVYALQTPTPPNPDQGAAVACAISKNGVVTEPNTGLTFGKYWPLSASTVRPYVGSFMLLAVNDTISAYGRWNGTNPAGPLTGGSGHLYCVMVCTNP